MMAARFRHSLLISLAVLTAAPNVVSAQHFKGRVAITQLHKQYYELLEDLSYFDETGQEWKAPKGYKTDGASIPWPLWSIVGAPFEGDYVKSAIIHDVYCDLKSRDWYTVHRNFYDSMIADGVNPIQAKIMYYAVLRFGPRWIVSKELNCPFGNICYASEPVTATINVRPDVNIDEFNAEKSKINDATSIEEIEAAANMGFYSSRNLLSATGSETKADGTTRAISETGHLGPQVRRAIPLNNNLK